MKYDIEKLNAIPVLEVAMKLGIDLNRNNKAQCFLHAEKTASLSFNQNENYWYCFGCGVGGGVIDLVKQYAEVDFLTACQWLEENFYGGGSDINIRQNINARTNETTKKNRLKNKLSFEVAECIMQESRLSQEALDYLCGQRGLSEKVVSRQNLKSIMNVDEFYKVLIRNFDHKTLVSNGLLSFDKGKYRKVFFSNGILIPYYSIDNELVTLQLRQALTENQEIKGGKYLFLKGISKGFYNEQILNILEQDSQLFICEGAFDALSLLGLGYNAVAVPGTASVNKININLLEGFNCRILFDNDKSGIDAAEILRVKLSEQYIPNRVLKLDRYNDVNEMFQAQRRKP
ncbi:MAG: CHC2 zinc finger domain-containing protein [Bacillota bacterium]